MFSFRRQKGSRFVNILRSYSERSLWKDTYLHVFMKDHFQNDSFVHIRTQTTLGMDGENPAHSGLEHIVSIVGLTHHS